MDPGPLQSARRAPQTRGLTPPRSNPSYVGTGRQVTGPDRQRGGLSAGFWVFFQTIRAPFSQ